MRKVELELDNLDNYVEGKTTGGFDWKADAETVLESVDEVLKERDLEIVIVDTGDDTFMFYVDQRRPAVECENCGGDKSWTSIEDACCDGEIHRRREAGELNDA